MFLLNYIQVIIIYIWNVLLYSEQATRHRRDNETRVCIYSTLEKLNERYVQFWRQISPPIFRRIGSLPFSPKFVRIGPQRPPTQVDTPASLTSSRYFVIRKCLVLMFISSTADINSSPLTLQYQFYIFSLAHSRELNVY